MKESVVIGLRTVVAAVCFAAVILARPHVGWLGLAVMLAGLGGLLILLDRYNRRFR
jgi:hypothetical protein